MKFNGSKRHKFKIGSQRCRDPLRSESVSLVFRKGSVAFQIEFGESISAIMTAQDSAVNIATAVIDLGIPVSQGLDEYYRDWNHFGADVHALCSSIKNLDCAFRAARDKLEGQEFALIRSMEDVQATIMFCEADIMELKKKLEKIKFKERPQSFKFKAAMGSVRSLYPFQRCTIKKIQDLVNSLRRRMQHILRAMNM